MNRFVASTLLSGIILVVSLMLSEYYYRAAYASTKVELDLSLVRLARVAAALIDTDLHETFTIPTQQVDDPRHLQQETLLQTIITADPRVIHIYTARLVDGEAMFILEPSKPQTTGEVAQAEFYLGDIYSEANPYILEALATKTEVISPLYKDSWGSFISAYVPLRKPDGKRLKSVMAVTMSTESYDLATSMLSKLRALFRFVAISCSVLMGVLGFVYWTSMEMAEKRRLEAYELLMAQIHGKMS